MQHLKNGETEFSHFMNELDNVNTPEKKFDAANYLPQKKIVIIAPSYHMIRNWCDKHLISIHNVATITCARNLEKLRGFSENSCIIHILGFVSDFNHDPELKNIVCEYFRKVNEVIR